jgi:conjugative relaxase-like TrwC/TraI family protein
MLRIIQSGSAADAKGYFNAELSKGDYYTENQQIAGLWGGKGAAILGLKGEVDKRSFHALCDNLDPRSGKQLTVRHKANRRVGYDISFHCPKSVSVLFERSGDEAIIGAFRQAVRETMAEMESAMRTQSTVNGEKVKPITGNIAYAEFVHLTSRPVGGLPPDPHIHAHCFTFNATYDPVAKRWQAGEFIDFYRDAPYYQAAFQARLAYGLKELGYAIRRTEHAFEIAGMPDTVIDKFSKRTTEIEQMAREQGITDASEKDKLGAYSRKRKNLDLSKEQLKAGWENQFTADELAAVRKVMMSKGLQQPGEEITAQAAVDYAIAHIFELSSVVNHRRLLAEALRYGVGDVLPEDVIREGQRPDILTREVDDEVLSTTREVLAEEMAMLQLAREGRNKCRPLSGQGEVEDAALNEEQVAAVKAVWQSTHQVNGILGRAGVGKTRLMTEAVRGIEAQGYQVFTFAPSADASRGVLREEGFATADTVARLLIDEKLQAELKGQVIWIDEAGLLGVRDMKRVLEIAREQKARVVLSGDYRQHSPVPRGDALRILDERAGVTFVEVQQIQRQKDPAYREAVEALSQGNVAEGFERLDRLGAVIEEPDSAARYKVLAKDYVTAVNEGESVIATAPTHAEGQAVTSAIRSELRANGQLGESQTFGKLENLHWTEAQKQDARNYEPGMEIQFHQNAGEVKGSEWVLGVGSPGNPAGVQQVAPDGSREYYLDLDDRGLVLKSRDSNEKGEYVLAYGKPGNIASIRKAIPAHDREFYMGMGPDGPELRSRSRSERQAGRSWTFAMGPNGPVLTDKPKPVRISRADRLTVLGRDEKGNVNVTNSQGQIFGLPKQHSDRFQVFKRESIDIAPGDKLRLTKNHIGDGGARFNNGDTVHVKNITSKGIELEGGGKLPTNHGHWAHGYCSTSHAIQGKTADQVLIAQSTASSGAASREQIYVSGSRGRDAVKIYTDDKDMLRQAVQKSSQRPSAMDLQSQQQPRQMPAQEKTQQRAGLLRSLGNYARTVVSRNMERVRAMVDKSSSFYTPTQARMEMNRINSKGRERGPQMG